MQIDRGSFLLGLVLGLALAVITLSGFVILAPRGGAADAAGPAASPTATIPGRVVPAATATTAPAATPTTLPTPQPTPTPTVVPVFYETRDVAPRRFEVVEITAAPGQTLEATVRIDSDVDVTLFSPGGEAVEGPVRVRGARTFTHQSPAGGEWVVKLDNSFSWITTKQVLVQYRVLPSH